MQGHDQQGYGQQGYGQPLNNQQPTSSGIGGFVGSLFGGGGNQAAEQGHPAMAPPAGAGGWQDQASGAWQQTQQQFQQAQQYASQQYASHGQQFQQDQQGHQYGQQGYQTAAGPKSMDDFAKSMQWTFLFFGAACCTLATGIIAIVFYILHLADMGTWSPCTFISAGFLIAVGFLAMVLDLPDVIMRGSANPRIMGYRHNIYTYMLFMTRFCGRGAWYFFLGSQCWLVLYDSKINRWLAVILTLYIVVVGIAAIVKGYMLSQRLQKVRQGIKESGKGAGSLFPKTAGQMAGQMAHMVNMATSALGAPSPSLSRNEFKDLCNQVTNTPQGQNYFTEDELSYVIGALSFKASHDDQVSLQEFEYWMTDGPLLLV